MCTVTPVFTARSRSRRASIARGIDSSMWSSGSDVAPNHASFVTFTRRFGFTFITRRETCGSVSS
jgi:hypothetical protein